MHLVYDINQFTMTDELTPIPSPNARIQVVRDSVHRPSDRVGLADPERIKYVTQNFKSLQGLYTIAFVAAVLAGFHIKGRWWMLEFFAYCAAFLCVLIYLPKYYRRRFGWLKKPVHPNRWGAKRVFALFVLIIVLPMFRRIGGYTETQSTNLEFGVLWLVLLCFYLWGEHLMDWRNAYFVPIILAVSSFYLYQFLSRQMLETQSSGRS